MIVKNKDQVLRVRMTDALMQAFRESAKQRGKSVSRIVRDALFRQEPDVFKRAAEIERTEAS